MSQLHDVVLYGATGFTGRQAARYFAAHAPAGIRWAIAGRDRNKLEAIAAETQPAGVIVADSQDADGLSAMVRQARVLLTTVGPYAKYGDQVLAACVRHRVDYVDITGETPWVRSQIDRHHETAAQQGVRIVPFCGFDSVPSDLGTLWLAEEMQARRGESLRTVSASFTMKGSFNGGTLDSALTMAESGAGSALADVLLLNPASHRSDAERARSRDLRRVVWDETRQIWLTPFFMAPINTRVVRRSNALCAQYGRPYGPNFTYREALEAKSKSAATALALGAGAFDATLRRGWGRRLLRRFGPSPGQGPSERAMDSGFFRVRLVGEAVDGGRLLATISRQGDPGNRVTVAILCEAALLLAHSDRDQLPGGAERGGILTPATGLGLPLLRRMEHAGFATEIEEIGAAPADAADKPSASDTAAHLA